jgi:hypothetical protein
MKSTHALLFVAAILIGVATVNAQTPPAVGGSGTTGFVPLWTSSTTIGNSLLFQSGADLTTRGNIFASGIRARAFVGNGSGLTSVNAAQLGGIAPSGFAQLGASSNTFSGTVSAASFAAVGGTTSTFIGNVIVKGRVFAGLFAGGSFTGNGSGLSNVNAAALGGIAPGGFAQLAAGSNSFTGGLSVGGTLSGYTVNSGNGGFQFAGTQVLSILPGLFNLYVGQSAGQGAGSNNTGSNNTSAGFQTLFLNTTGGFNTAMGSQALYSNTTGGENTAIGTAALYSNTAGSPPDPTNTLGRWNTAVGSQALYGNSTGSSNTATGQTALYSNTTGANNTATGRLALSSNTMGNSNTATGANALISNTTGNGNTALGIATLNQLGTGSDNTAIGVFAGFNFTGSESNNIDLNNNGVVGESGVIRIGTAPTQTATYIAGINGVTTGSSTTSTVLVDSNGQLGTIASSRRYKEDIRDMGAASDRLLRLRPVTFHYKKPYADGSKPIQYGLIGEEVAEFYPDLVVRGKDGEVETVQYYKLDAMLLNEVQKLAKQHAADQAEIAKLQVQAQEQLAAMEQLQAQVRVIREALAGGGSADGEQRLAAVGPAEGHSH